jgi:hypothetical protein
MLNPVATDVNASTAGALGGRRGLVDGDDVG